MSVFFSSPCISPRSLYVALLAFWILHSLTWETIFSGCLLGEAARYHEAWLVGGSWACRDGHLQGMRASVWRNFRALGSLSHFRVCQIQICTGQERAGKEHLHKPCASFWYCIDEVCDKHHLSSVPYLAGIWFAFYLGIGTSNPGLSLRSAFFLNRSWLCCM